MKVIHTFVEKNKIIWKELLYLQYLSAVLAKKHYGNISFYGDEESCKIVRDLGIPYDEINSSVLEGLDVTTWSVPKIKVYESIKEPFLHIDTDTLIFSKIDFNTYKSDFVFSHVDMDTPQGMGRDQLLKSLYQYYFTNLGNEDLNKKTIEEITDLPFKTFTQDTYNSFPKVFLQGFGKKESFFYMNKTYTKLFFDLCEKINSTIFDNAHFASIPNMNIVYVRNWETFSESCTSVLDHYDKNKREIDKNSFGSCYIEQLMIHIYLRVLDKKYKKQSKRGDHVVFDNNPITQIDPHNNVASIDKVEFPFRLRVLNQSHLKCECCNNQVITSLSRFEDFYNTDEDDKFKIINIDSKDDVPKLFDEEFNGFLHVSYLKWYDIFQAMIIDKLKNEVGNDVIIKIHNYYKEKYLNLDLPLISGGEKLYSEISHFKFKEDSDELI